MTLSYRAGGIDDSQAAFEVFLEAMLDLGRRIGSMPITGGDDPRVIPRLWEARRSLFEHLANTADQFWVAERGPQVVGYARSTLRDGVRQLTEFFVRPGEQSQGVGRELLSRAFPTRGARRRTIVATTDTRAQARYLKSGVTPTFPIAYFSKPAEGSAISTDLDFEPVSSSMAVLESLRTVDENVLEVRRDADHAWLLSERAGYLYRRGGRVVGYGYLGPSAGPFALLDPRDYAAVLAHAEAEAAHRGADFGVEVPLVNRAAVDFLLGRGFRMDSFLALFMADVPFGRFDRYLFTSPPFFL
ncbi:MAG: GNAT family N-acetyltransferase [Anaerolineales bacterium]